MTYCTIVLIFCWICRCNLCDYCIYNDCMSATSLCANGIVW